MPFSFLQRGNLSEHARQMQLSFYSPEISVQGLATGVDNIRVDVFLSPRFVDVARQHLLKLLVKYGGVEDFVKEDPFSRPNPAAQPRPGGYAGSPAAKGQPVAPAKPVEPADFKKALTDLHVVALNRAKNDENVNLDLLARLSVLKFLRVEIGQQFAQLTERCRIRLKSFDGARGHMGGKAVEMREGFARLQVTKKIVMRKTGQDVFEVLREIEKETLSKLRRSLLGDQAGAAYDLFLNRLLFTADGNDDYLNAEQYVMLGSYERDPDRFQHIQDIAIAYLKSLNLPGMHGDDDKALDTVLNVPENAQELVAGGAADESTPKGKAQKALLSGWLDALEKEEVMDRVVAAYEVGPILNQYSPPINAQQLKNALATKVERKRVESLLSEHSRISPEAFHQAVKKVEKAGASDRAKFAGRFFLDFVRYHRDFRRFEAVLNAMDGVNLIVTEKLRELSAINNTLYEFLLPEEQKQTEANVVSHIILKADIRDSTTLTRTLYERGLNPASYFSLNFFEPVNKLLPKYDAGKVFIEGDAVILALFERAGEQGFGVGRTCAMAREMIQIVRAYNEQSQKAGLPNLELGLGICHQDSAPMYLMDGTQRIMISKALNESDRLSGCSKGARKYVKVETPFSVFSFETVEDADTGGMPEEFLVRYNIGGIHMNVLAFEKLKKEISLKEHLYQMQMLYGQEKVKLYSGLVPVGQGIFHRIIVREGLIPHINPRDFTFQRWTEKKYYEVVVNEKVYEKMTGAFDK
ncbi:MAG: hypothetical protein HYX26_02935 [Acidobacteriales bacterium]|nr:hypothetical protein [Terriglobales bacterium]